LDEPFLSIIAGPNGSGKTTLTQWLRSRSIELGEYINPDDIASELDGSCEERTAEAQIIADHRREACINAKRSFSFETVMSHPSKIDILRRAKEKGFFVQLFFVGTDDPQTNIERVALRVAQGGHDVPTDRIVARWLRTMMLLPEAVRSADRVAIFDNSATFAGELDALKQRRRNAEERWRPNSFAWKWLALAKRRRDHLVELYNNGLWRRYFQELVLKYHLRDAIKEVERWEQAVQDVGPRLVFWQDSVHQGMPPRVQQFPPIPKWVQYHLFEPLDIDPIG
jgi:predicted ABC-type ATPase